MRRLLVPLLAVLLCAPAAHAKPMGCPVVFDAVDDVQPRVDPRVGERYKHLDVTWGTVEWVRGELVARIYVRDAQPILDGARGTWTLTFTARGRSAVVTARTGALSDPATFMAPLTFSAGIAGRDGLLLTPVPGRVATGRLEITVPPLVFGEPAVRAGDVLSGFRMESADRMPLDALSVRDTADAQRAGTYAGPGRCRMPA